MLGGKEAPDSPVGNCGVTAAADRHLGTDLLNRIRTSSLAEAFLDGSGEHDEFDTVLWLHKKCVLHLKGVQKSARVDTTPNDWSVKHLRSVLVE